MKQTHIVAKKEWDVLFVLDTGDGFATAMDDAGILYESFPVFNRFFQNRGQWFERNFLQFQDGRHSDITLISASRLLWKPRTEWLLSAFGDAIPSWKGRRRNKNIQAIKDAGRVLKKSPDQRLVIHLEGGVRNLPDVAAFAEDYRGLAAITTIAEERPLWVWIDAVVSKTEAEEELLDAAIAVEGLESGETLPWEEVKARALLTVEESEADPPEAIETVLVTDKEDDGGDSE